eukprot:TRINITY_DN32800_c0_g1_i1.p1 TRINITY_DN32800_c0_g1~~TRINITY_DN32800_c0_g1_i1.p1  ORF type:complete len:324 (+),score=71.12 TRINITY_DN32800_c0_g1_i1:73-1044(+)
MGALPAPQSIRRLQLRRKHHSLRVRCAASLLPPLIRRGDGRPLRRSRGFATLTEGPVLVAPDPSDPRIAVVALNEPGKLNAVTEEMGQCFAGVVADLARDPEDRLRCVVLTGRGNVFSAGGDAQFLQSCQELGAKAEAGAQERNCSEIAASHGRFLKLRDLPVPVVAAINGNAVGPGLSIALLADLRYVAEDAVLAANFGRMGLPPVMGTSALLARAVGQQRAAEMLFTGEPLNGQTAANLGLCCEALPKAAVFGRALAVARQMVSRNCPRAMRRTVALLRDPPDTVARAAAAEARAQTVLHAEGAGIAEGMAAAAAGRDPRF